MDEARANELLDLVEQARAEGDSVTEQKAIAAYRSLSAPAQPEQPQKQPSRWEQMAQAASTATRGYLKSSPLVGIGEAALALGSGAVAAPVAGMAGAVAAPFVGADKAANVVTGVQDAASYRPSTPIGRAATEALTYLPGKLAQAGDAVGQGAANLTGSPAAGAVVNTAVQSIPALFTRGRVGRGSSSTNRPGRVVAAGEAEAPRPAPPKGGRNAGLEGVPEKPPSIDELKAQAKAAYKRADDAGIKVSGNSVKALKVRIVSDLKDIDSTLHPDATAALKRVTSAKGDLSLADLETLRKIASDAEGSIKPADARLAGKIVDHIDDFVENLGDKDVLSGTPEAALALKEARGLYSRQKKAEDINRLFERAEISAPNFSGSGMENALRTEFRSLAKNDRKMRRFNAEERAAIKKVAMGGPLENLLRQIGKAAPTGIVSAGMGTMAGFAMGGPLGAAALPALGTAGRFAATRMTMKNANAAETLMRRGPSKPSVRRKPAKVTADE
jgi:hypothetical protein